MKKIFALLLSLVMLFSLALPATAEELSSVTYYMEYGDGTATVIFQAGSLNAFDFGVIYDPDEVSIVEYDYSEEFYAAAIDDTYTSVYVKNDKAVDDVGNSTYVVFTGAIMYTEDGSDVNFGEKDIASVTFTGIDEGDEIGVVLGTGKVQDVKNAQHLGAVDLYEQTEIGDTELFDGAIAEPEKETNNNDSEGNGNKLIYGVIIAVVVVAAVVVILVSKKNTLDVSDNRADDEE